MSRFGSFREKLKTLLLVRLAFRHVWRASPRLMIAGFVLLVSQGLMPLATLYLMKLIVDAVTAGIASLDKAAAFERIVWLIALAAGIGLLGAALSALSTIVREYQQSAFQDHMQEVILSRSVDLDLEYYENPKYYDALFRAQREGFARPVSIVHGLIQICQNGISLVAIATLLLSLHWSVGAILLGAVLPGLFVRLKYADTLYKWERRMSAIERMGSYFQSLLTTVAAAKEVRIFGLGPLFLERYREVRRRVRGERLKLSTALSIKEVVTQSFGIVAVFGAFAFLSFRVLHGQITLGDLVMYYQGIQRGLGFLTGMLGSMTRLYEDSLFLSNLDEFLALENHVMEPAIPVPMPRPIRDGIVLDRVSFQYPGSSRPVLRDVSLTIEAGQAVALVGENGAGKTTLIKLLCRLYDPTGGSISVDGIDLRRFSRSELRKEICPIFQDYLQLHLSAAENIWLGNVHDPPDYERIASAARMSGADTFLQGLPNSYETRLGRLFEDGAELSSGQWQRVALARALYGEGQIVVLDEPTSSQDARSEYDLFQRFREVVRDRVAVIVSHRFSTVRMADCIYVLEDGRIIEGGSHEELIELGGTYAQLFRLHARAWR